MSLPTDPIMLMSFINTKLRDFYKNLDELCDDMDIEKDALCNTLAQAGFEYDAGHNKFV